MSDVTRSDRRLDELLAEWHMARQRGQPLSVESLCQDCPEMVTELQSAIERMDDSRFHAVTTADFNSNQEPAPPDIRLPGFDIIHVLGRGGMGVVFLARQHGLKRLVAIKMVLAGAAAGEKSIARFMAEAEMLAKLRHPNIVQIFTIGDHQGSPYFVMEYVAGGSLVDRIKQGPMDARETAAILADVAEAVHAAHQIGIVHRDLKPGNILLHEEFSPAGGAPQGAAELGPTVIPKLTDFGLARDTGSGENLTASGIAMGTPAYMAPEQALGHSEKFGPATDVFGLGIVLYECLTGKPPFKGPNDVQTMQQVVRADPKAPSSVVPSVPKALDAVCSMCLRNLPKHRYGTAAELAADLRRFLANEQVLAKPPGVFSQILGTLHRRPFEAGVLAAFLAGVVLTLFVVLFKARPVEYSDDQIRSHARRLRVQIIHDLLARKRKDGWFPQDLAKPLGPSDAWAHFHAISALLESAELSDELARRDLWRSLAVPFEPGAMVEQSGQSYGWASQQGRGPKEALSTPTIFAISAIANAHRRKEFLTDDQKSVTLRYLSFLQSTMETAYRLDPVDGGWALFPHQQPPNLTDPFATVSTLRALLLLNRAQLNWAGDEPRRDQLIRETIGSLLRSMNSNSEDPGWRASPFAAESVNEGLTLLIAALLLQARAELNIELPYDFDQLVATRLDLIQTARWGRHPDMAARLEYGIGWPGEAPTVRQQAITLLWYPWAIAAASHWQRHNAAIGNTNELRRARRVLSQLVVDQGDRAVSDSLKSWLFKATEILEALNTIP